MTFFWLLSLVFVVIAYAFVVLPLFAKQKIESTSYDVLNTSIYKDRLKTLEAEFQSGQFAEAQFEQAKQELARTLLSDTQSGSASDLQQGNNFKVAIAILIIIPLVAYSGYNLYGAADQAPDIIAAQKLPPRSASPQTASKQMQTIQGMVSGLAKRLKESPDDAKGWRMLARSYVVLKEYKQAETAYEKAWKLVDFDPELILDYARIIATNQQNSYLGKPEKLIDEILAKQPEHPVALFYHGIIAEQKQQPKEAIRIWKKVKTLLKDEPESIEKINGFIADASKAAGLPVEQNVDSQVQPQADESNQVKLSVQVALSAELLATLSPDMVVFVFAKALKGPRMPLAIVRTTVSALPGTFELNDQQAMMAEMKLSNFDQVKINARASASGSAMPGQGDFLADELVVSSRDQSTLSLLISRPYE
jgi:cytochrome c-type biogenesis protein CcmH